jgi:hypothetical protein
MKPCSSALLQWYFSANEQCFSLTINQHKPNFSVVVELKRHCTKKNYTPMYRAVWSSVHFFLMRWENPRTAKRVLLGWLTAVRLTCTAVYVRACRWWIAESDLPSDALPAGLVSLFDSWVLAGRPSQSGPFLNSLFIRTRLCELLFVQEWFFLLHF